MIIGRIFNKNNYTMDKIRTHWIAGTFMPGVHIGWSFYPIIYKEKQYVVDLKGSVKMHANNKFNIVTICCIYDYEEEKKLFRKHRRTKLWEHDISTIKIDEDKLLELSKTTEDELKMYIPQILKTIFEEYEVFKKKQEIITDNIEKWNGVIS